MKESIITFILFFVVFQFYAQYKDSIYHRDVIWRETIRSFEKEDQRKPPRSSPILFIGSSSITNWKNLHIYFPDKNVLNRGFGGSELRDVIFYFNRIVTPYRPSQIVLYEGDNDITFGQTAEQFLDDIKTFVRLVEIHLPGTPIIILSIKKSKARSHFSIEFDKANALLYQFAQTKRIVQFVDVAQILFDENGNIKDDCFESDNLHINTRGYWLWTDILKNYLK
ncbi:GDSL-type esterase/lipase family protein [Capnocytophaga canis]|uniref:Acetylhydrolase n=1 Tax=Capnocytophaga canis TaxID=1848903 RepID=A0A3A1YKJ4_9FLAO|nr:GDSL-type esterase/lipase family protein [Capnocytophaga canis]RIY36557.1 acetylhydrolase [Capnocytophaga canis]